MSRAPAVPEPSRETFAGLLQHFAQPASGGEMRGEDEAVRVSISGRGAAALAEERKRLLTPVKVVARSGNRASSEATEISYEKALRLLSRHRPPSESTQALAEQEQRKAEPTPRNLPEQRRRTSPAPAADQRTPAKGARPPRSAHLHVPPAASGQAKAATRSEPESAAASARGRSAAAGDAAAQSSTLKGETLAKTAASLKRPVSPQQRKASAAAARSPLRHREHSPSAESGKCAAGKSGAGLAPKARPSRAERRQGLPTPPAAGTVIEQQKASPGVERARAAAPAALEIARHEPTPEQRNAIVSIRVNDMEFERLRLRAAESGLSVSAYMRSCVLEAEHLRAQVKQALAEMRSSIHLAQPAQPAAPIAVLAREHHTTAAGSWTRFLWRSATFVLGPLLAFRHRS